MTPLVRRRGRELRDPHVARIESTDEPLDRATFAGRVPSFEQDENRRSESPAVDESTENESQVQQTTLRVLELHRFLLVGQTKCEIERTEPGHHAIRPPAALTNSGSPWSL
jgi:hypothetical protein